MSEKNNIKINKKKKRVPLPQKPPKIEEDKKTYNRKNQKKKTKKEIEEYIKYRNSKSK